MKSFKSPFLALDQNVNFYAGELQKKYGRCKNIIQTTEINDRTETKNMIKLQDERNQRELLHAYAKAVESADSMKEPRFGARYIPNARKDYPTSSTQASTQFSSINMATSAYYHNNILLDRGLYEQHNAVGRGNVTLRKAEGRENDNINTSRIPSYTAYLQASSK